ncbi:hypothetical protein B0H14DRAFT_714527 [Mycena olivaceomarginata]|nr:hypothetical protein B0H14DRAFT_714527 [Mycena olivaceomarginata]
MIFVFIPLVLSFKSQAQHQSGMFNHVQWYALDTHMQGKEVSSPFALHLTSVLLVCNQNQRGTLIEGSLASIEGRLGAVCFGSHYIRLAMCTRLLLFSANLFKPSPAWGRGTRKLNAFHVVTHAPTQTLLRARCQPKLYSSSEPTFHPHFTDMFTVGLRLLTRLPVVFPAFSEL